MISLSIKFLVDPEELSVQLQLELKIFAALMTGNSVGKNV